MSSSMRRLGRLLFGKYLLITNTAVSGCLMAAGDAAAQMIEQRRICSLSEIDSKRTGRYFLYGLLMGPVNHGWYCVLDKMLPSITSRVVVQKIALDQTIAGPVNIMAFFVGLSSLEGKHINTSVTEAKKNFWSVYKIDLMVWPAAQLINFFWIPKEIRMMYVCTVSFAWTTFLAYYRNNNVSQLQSDKQCSNKLTKSVQSARNSSQKSSSLESYIYNYWLICRNIKLVKKTNVENIDSEVHERRRKILERIKS